MYKGPVKWFASGSSSWRHKEEPESGEYMTVEELSSRLTILSGKLVEELLKTTERMLKADDDRVARMESKAANLLSSFGLVLTVVFALGASTLLPHPEYFSRAGRTVLVLFAVVVLIAAISGIAFAAFSVASVRIKREWRGLEPREVLNEVVIKEADIEDAEKGVREYRRHLIGHYFMISQQNHVVYKARIAWVRRAQHAYMMFLFSVLSGAAVILVAALKGR